MSVTDHEAAGERPAPRLPPDLVVGAVVLLLCALAYAITLTFKEAPAAVAQNVQPATFPRLVIGVIAVLTAAMMFLGRLLPAKRRAPVGGMVWLSALVMVLFVLTITWLGILPAMILLCLGLPVLWGERRAGLVLPFGIGFPLVVYWLFAQVLDVHFAPSLLVFW